MQLAAGRELRWAVGAAILSAVCGACSAQPSSTGGVDLALTRGPDGRACGHGLAVVQTDYVSTNVALLDLKGNLQSASFIHSGSGQVELNAPLGGDVVFPSAGSNNELVLIDRYPASVISFVDTKSARVRGQLNVRTGFDANPRDFLQLEEGRALVARYERNTHPGDEKFDGGDDLLVVDPRGPKIVGRIDLGGSPDQRMRPSAMLALEDEVIISLNRLNPTFGEAHDAQLLVLDRDDLSEVDRWTLKDMQVCEGLSLSPDESQLVVSCSGLLDQASSADPAGSGVVVLDIAAGAGDWREVARTSAATWGLGPLGFGVDHASQDLVLLTTFGALEGEDAGRPDRLLVLDVSSQKMEVLLAGEAFALGGLICSEPCGLCYLADAETSDLHIVDVRDDMAVRTRALSTGVHLPPRLLQLF